MELTISAGSFKSVPPPVAAPFPPEPAGPCAVVTACDVKVSADKAVGPVAVEDDVPVKWLVWMVAPAVTVLSAELA